MAATRPAVLVFQEFASLSTPAATPELNCLIAGPAYWIQDFPDHRANIKLTSNYGTKNAAATGSSVAPVGSDVVVVTDVPNNKVGAKLDTDSVKVYLGVPRVELANGNDGTVVVSPTPAPTLASAAVDFLVAGVAAGDWCILTNNAGTGKQVRKIRSVAQHTLTFTSDVGAVLASEGDTGIALVNAANTKFRVERELTDSLVDSTFITTVPSTNEVHINGSITLLVGGVAKPVSYGEPYIAYRSLRQDLAVINTLSSVTEIVGQLGLIDARNPLAVGAFTTLTNSSASIQVFGVVSQDLTGYTAMKAALATRKDVYAVVPLIQDISVIAMLKTEFENLADPDYVVTNGVAQKFRMVIGAPTAMPTTKIVVDANHDGQSQINGSALVVARTFVFPSGNLITVGVLPGDKLVIAADTAVPTARNGTYTVARVNSATELEVDQDIIGGADTGDATVTINVGQTVATRSGYNAQSFTGLLSQANDALYLDLFDANGTFIDSGVIPGDLLEMPLNPTQTSFADSAQLVIATVVSNQRVRVVNNGGDTSLVVNEVPHLVSRNAPVTTIPNTATLTYRVVRALDKDGQVTELITVAQSLRSRRAVICWPDLVDITDLKDGSLPRTSPAVPAPAASQPGYYLACAVGGLLASLPSHQGLTNLGIAGISKLYDANTYFDDKQMSAISNGGWLVFQQDTPSALPYIIHQLTTDPSTLEFGELSMVKNFDFVSLFFSDILNPFIGTWNINTETLGFIVSALQAGIDNLKLRRRVRIGAPIIDARITSVAESIVSADRVEAYIEADFPKPLNTVGLHIVSV
jgi:hypothetical protein